MNIQLLLYNYFYNYSTPIISYKGETSQSIAAQSWCILPFIKWQINATVENCLHLFSKTFNNEPLTISHTLLTQQHMSSL